MSQPSTFWQRYGTLAQMAQATVALLGFVAILRKIDQRTERMAEDLHDLKVGITSVEEGLVGVNRRLDRLENRVERIEKRLELSDASH